jgi:hypothetical protein
VRLIEVITYKDMAVKPLKNGTALLEEFTNFTGLLTKLLKELLLKQKRRIFM